MKKEDIIKSMRAMAEEKEYEDIPFLTDEELESLYPIEEEDYQLGMGEDPEVVNKYYELKDELRLARKEFRDLEKSIEEDTNILDNPATKWHKSGFEKTEWQHDLSHQRLQKEELRLRINQIRRELNALIKGNTHGR